MEKKFKFSKFQSIGSPDAETDDNLFDVFIRSSNLEEIIDVRNQKSILIGRTGSGKSAIIKYLKKNCDHISEIAPESMSLRFLSNSTILKYFKSIDVNLNLFYKVLWKHIFIVELLKMYFENYEQGPKKGNFFQNLLNNLSNKNPKEDSRKRKAISYMETWTHDFWEQTEVKVKTFETNIQKSFASSMGVSIDALESMLKSSSSFDEKQIYDVKQKAESIIQNSQVIELIDIIQIMKDDLFTNHQKKFYIVVDDLDKEWIEDTIRYELIAAMIEVIKELRQLSGVKIIISLRENLNEIVYSGLNNKGIQREKFKPLFSDLIWNRDELTELIDSRLRRLSNEQIDIKQAFHQVRRSNLSGFDYVLSRTFLRPRDAISFVNHMIEKTDNSKEFSKDIISKVEPSYSLDRFQALEDEWYENYGKIKLICEFLRGINNGFRLRSINESSFEDLYLDRDLHKELKGEAYAAIVDWSNSKTNFVSFTKKILFILFRIGIIGIKKGPTYKLAFYYDKEILIDRVDFSNNSKFYVHPSLYSYFKVNVLEQLPE